MADRDVRYSAKKPTWSCRLPGDLATEADRLRRIIPNADGGVGIGRSEFTRKAIAQLVSNTVGREMSDQL